MDLEKFPELTEGQYALIHCEVETGIVTLPDGRRYFRDDAPDSSLGEWERWGGKGQMWLVFDTLSQAKEYALNKINEIPRIECAIFDYNYQRIEVLRNQNYLDVLETESKLAQSERRKPWFRKVLERISKWL